MLQDNLIQFYGNNYTRIEWEGLQKTLDGLFSVGQWEKVTALGDILTDVACTFEHPFIEKYKTGQCSRQGGNIGNTWKWQPRWGEMHWDPLEMCHLLRGRNVLFLGDSMQSSFI